MSSLTTESFPPPRHASANGAGPTDIDLLRSLRWSAGSEGLAAAARRGDAAAFAREVGRDLTARFGRDKSGREDLAVRFPAFEAEAAVASGWFFGEEAGGEGCSNLVRTAALLDGLRRFGGRLEPGPLWRLWRRAWLAAAGTAAAAEPESRVERLLTAEVLWASGVLFEGAPDARARMKAGRAKLLAEFELRTDDDGTPHTDLLPQMPAWFGTVVRIVGWAAVADRRLWNAAYSGRFDGLVRAVAASMRADGRLVFAAAGDLRPLLGEAVRRSGWKTGSPVERLVRKLERAADGGTPTKESVPRRVDRKSPPAVQSDWAKLVVSRARWRADSDGLAIAYAGAVPSIEFLARGRAVLSGRWGLGVRIDGEELAAADAEWESVCWFSDADADYVELLRPNEQGVVICRQVLLTRGDHQLFLADSVSTPARPGSVIEVETVLPLAEGAGAETLRPSRELRLTAGGLPVRAFPLALPMERTEGGAGTFEAEGRTLVARHRGTGGVYVPLVFDWNPCRREAYADWRTLTVTEDRRRLGGAEASAHRVRIGARQLFVYHRLNESKAQRTVLGHHHSNESVIGRFTSEGEVDPLVLVE